MTSTSLNCLLDARARQNYLMAWTATPGGGGVIFTPTRQTLSKYVLLIATISISATLAYYLVKKQFKVIVFLIDIS